MAYIAEWVMMVTSFISRCTHNSSWVGVELKTKWVFEKWPWKSDY